MSSQVRRIDVRVTSSGAGGLKNVSKEMSKLNKMSKVLMMVLEI